MQDYAKWFSRVVWLGAGMNILFVISLCFFPEFLLSLLDMQIPVPIIWVRAAGLLLLEISVLHIPVALDPYRYRAIAWMLAVLSRGGGAAFFLCAVLFFGQAWGFLTIALVDLFFGVIEGVLLFLALRTEPAVVSNTAPELAK